MVANSAEMKHNWKLEYDSTLSQYYYVNTETNSISFDLPCEVKRKSHTPSFLRKLSFKRKRSNDSDINCTQAEEALKRAGSSPMSPQTSFDAYSQIPSSPQTKFHNNHYNYDHLQYNDDEYLYNNPTNFKNFAGTSLTPDHDDNESINSDYSDDQSIITFYSDLDMNEYANDDNYTFDKEKERIELRLQFLRELQV